MAVYGRGRGWTLPYQAPAQGGGSNEPAGMTQISDQPFTSLPSNGWTDYAQNIGGAKPAIVTDATGPVSPSNVVLFNYPVGMQSGGDDVNSPGQCWCDNPGFTARTLYVRFHMKYSANWDGEVTSMNKIMFIRNEANHGEIVICGIGTNANPILATIYMQGLAGGGVVNGSPGDGTTGQYQSTVDLRGGWRKYEVVTRMNSAGNLDGTCDIYLDGASTPSASASGVKFENTGTNWSGLGFVPIWGGGGDTIAGSAQQLWVDHIYVSGKAT